jgi:hypothetical protein
MIYRHRVLRGGYIGKNYTSKRNHRRKPDGNEFQGVLTPGWRGQGWARAPVCEEHPDSFFCPFSSCDFSYLVKIAKILKEEFNAKLF